MLRVGILGYGYWGPNLVRNFSVCSKTEVGCVCDVSEERLTKLRSVYPDVKSTKSYAEMLADPTVDAVAIATNVSTHYKFAMMALKAGKHVLVEKPFTATAKEGEELIAEAKARKLTLMVDHTFLFTPAVQKIRELIKKDEIGDLYYFDSVRINLGLFQHDVNVIWDLAVHDLAIMEYVLGASPKMISATGAAHVKGRPEDVAHLTCFFENNLMAHFHVNWLSPVKVRQMLIGGAKKMIVWDDMNPSEKIKVYDKGITITNTEDVYKMMVNYRSGDMYAPHLGAKEALLAEAEHFAECVETGKTPLTNAESGLRIVKILEAAEKSLKNHGAPVEI